MPTKTGNEAAKAELLHAAKQVLGLDVQFHEMYAGWHAVEALMPTNITIHIGQVRFEDGKVTGHTCVGFTEMSAKLMVTIVKEMDQKYVFRH